MGVLKVFINKITAALLILITVALLVFFGAYLIAPAATAESLSDMPGWISDILKALTFRDSETALSIGTFFEKIGIPSYVISVADIPVLNVNLVAIILFVALLFASNFFKPISLITTLTVDVIGGVTALGIIEGYKQAVASGTSSWAAASSVFFPMLVILTLLLFSGCDQWVGAIAGLDERRHLSEYFVYSTGFLFVSVVISFVLTVISWLIMGFGWAGFLFFSLFLVCLASIIAESISLFSSSYD